MKTFYKWYPWVAAVVIVIIGFVVPGAGIPLLLLIVLTLTLYNVKIVMEPRWGLKPEEKEAVKSGHAKSNKVSIDTSYISRLFSFMKNSGMSQINKGKKAPMSSGKKKHE
jgi:hypothetical protein